MTGSGRCGTGSLEILELLPYIYLDSLEDLEKLYVDAKKNPSRYDKTIYLIHLTSDKIMRKSGDISSKFEKKEYYEHPERFECIFQKQFLKYLSVFVNGIYWDDRYPRLIQKKFLQNYYK